jgi:hypothetical protein
MVKTFIKRASITIGIVLVYLWAIADSLGYADTGLLGLISRTTDLLVIGIGVLVLIGAGIGCLWVLRTAWRYYRGDTSWDR